jgi:A/G-specific adenine glycosylase
VASAPCHTLIAPALIDWHGHSGRHDLPWQHDRVPYRVWVSEIMLQQTQVSTVVSYYQRFMQRFPSVTALAAAPLDEVLHLWSGLGYYARARHLHRAAQQIVRDHGGELPQELEQLTRLPGIGRSTAAAILALAHGRRATILDGNVKRVLSRVFGIAGRPGTRATEQLLWQCAERCTPRTHVATYTQAIMDLGATLCTRARPQCALCPLRTACVAYRSDRVHELPPARQRATRPLRRAVLLLASRTDGAVLLQRRPSRGVWASLWTPPQFDSLEAAALFCSTQLQGAQLEREALPPVAHRFTHFDLEMTPVRAYCTDIVARVAEVDEVLWYSPRTPARIGVPAPIATLLARLAPVRVMRPDGN